MALQLVAVSPAALGAGNNNDYAGIGASSFARLSANAAGSTLTGATGGADGRVLVIVNLANVLTITHQDANSAAANRFFTATGISIVLAANDTAVFVYDSTTARWRQVTGVV